jgi:xylulokinase
MRRESYSKMNQALLGIDIGTTNAKAALFDTSGVLLGEAQQEYDTVYARPGWAEQTPGDWWNATVVTVRRLLNTLPVESRDIAAISVSSQAPTVLPVDDQGTPLRPALIWMDRRSEDQCVRLRQTVDADRLMAINGNRIDPYFGAPKILWLLENEPYVAKRTRFFLQANGYINFKLTGRFTIDASHASLVQCYDMTLGDWSDELCSTMRIPRGKLPPVLPCTEVIGKVSAHAARATGLLSGTPVVAGAVDGVAAALEAGVVASGEAVEMTGTSTVLLICVKEPPRIPALIALAHAVPGAYLLVGAMVSTGANLRWFRDELGTAEVQAARSANCSAFEIMSQEAGMVSPGAGGLLFLPYMMGERSPIWNTYARGILFGLSLATTRAQVVRALMEGAAYGLRHNVDIAEETGIRIRVLRSVGGGSHSVVWSQIKADVLGRPIEVVGTSMGAPLGDALLAGTGVGIYSSVAFATQSVARAVTHYWPEETAQTYYEIMARLYRQLYAANEVLFVELARNSTPGGD